MTREVSKRPKRATRRAAETSLNDRVTDVVERLEHLILSQQLAPGDRLPAERELCSQLNVSRSVVREAIGRLQSLGRLVSQHGSGTRVAVPSGQQVSSGYAWLLKHEAVRLEDLGAVRLPLETVIVEQAALHRTSEQLEELARTQTILGDKSQSLTAQIAADVRFHEVLAEATGNPIFRLILAPIQKLLIESRRRTLKQFGANVAYEHHADILKAVADQKPEKAVAAMQKHLRVNLKHLQDS